MLTFKQKKIIEKLNNLDVVLDDSFYIIRHDTTEYKSDNKFKLKLLEKEDDYDLDKFRIIIKNESEVILTDDYKFILKEGKIGKDGYTPIKGKDYFDGKDGVDGISIKGDIGTSGKDGYTPIKGKDYFDGKDGVDGYTPIKGVDYFDGERGLQGLQGTQGLAGLVGKRGLTGKDGYTPIKGKDYFDGKDGVDGYTPIKGVDYFDGKDGVDGLTGKDGVDGYTPIKGVDYFDGKDGVDGKDGRSIKGEQGLTGKDGERGLTGKDGKNGYTPIKGVDYFDGKDGKQGIQGLNGIQGIPGLNGTNGINGKDGVDGSIPHHEVQRGKIRFEAEKGVWGEWIDLAKLVNKLNKNSNSNMEMIGGGGSNLDFFVGDQFYRDIKYLNFDTESLVVSKSGDVLTIGVNPNYASGGSSNTKFTYDYFKLTYDNQTDFLLTHFPTENSETVILNGSVLTLGLDYTIEGMLVMIDTRHNTKTNWNLTIKYSY